MQLVIAEADCFYEICLHVSGRRSIVNVIAISGVFNGIIVIVVVISIAICHILGVRDALRMAPRLPFVHLLLDPPLYDVANCQRGIYAHFSQIVRCLFALDSQGDRVSFS